MRGLRAAYRAAFSLSGRQRVFRYVRARNRITIDGALVILASLSVMLCTILLGSIQ